MNQVVEEHAVINQARYAEKPEKVGFLKQIRNIIGRSRTALIFSGVLAISSIKTAFAEQMAGRSCTLFVLPYSPSAPKGVVGDDGLPYMNPLSSETCNEHVAHRNQYQPQPPPDAENPLRSGTENIRLPIATHWHAYVNNSGDNNYYYKAAIDKFEITIGPDGYRNIIHDQISCVTPVVRGYSGDITAIHDCNGNVPDLFGGTKVTKSIDSATQTIRITWDFGTTTHKDRPIVFGNNDRDFVIHDSVRGNRAVDLSDPENRMLKFAVNLRTKDNGQIWSATTTSRVLLGDLAMLRSHYPANFATGCAPDGNFGNPNSGWCYVPPPQGYQTENLVTPSGNRTYYWFPIGSVASVWKKPPPASVVSARPSPTEDVEISRSSPDGDSDALLERTEDIADPRELTKKIDTARSRGDYKKAHELRAKLFSIPVTDFSNNQLHQLATKAGDQLYAETSELETICERTAQEIQRTSGEKQQALMKLFEMCYNRFVFNPSTSEKGLHYILIKYAIQSGQNDKQTLLRQIAFNIRDAFLSVTALQSAGQYEEAADLLTFYFQTNPSLMDYKSDRVENFIAEANNLRNQGAPAALDYYQNRVRVKQWEKRLDKILRVAVPVGIILWSSSEAEKEKERKATEARAKAEEAARQRQIARDQENARRRTQGLPSLEEEERRESERREAIRGQTRARCLENCETRYHSCMGITDMRCCGTNHPYLGCDPPYCPTECETGLSSCRNKCD